MKIKSKDIAKALGISTATVSLAINNKPGVNEGTRQEIFDYIRTHQQGQKIADSGEIKNVSMIVMIRNSKNMAEDVGSLFNLSYQESCRIMNEHGYDVNLIYFDPHKEQLEVILEQCRRKRTSGIFVFAFVMSEEQLQVLSDCEIPLMIYDHTFFCKNGDNTLFDNGGAVKCGLDYLYQMGHEKIIYLANKAKYVNFSQRLRECTSYIAPKGKTSPQILLVGSELSEAYQDVMEYLNSCRERPTAIFGENDLICISTIHALNDCKLRIGEDISLIGIDELPETVFIDFSYTHIQMLHQKKAGAAARRLIYRMENSFGEENIVIYVRNRFVEGDSVKQLNGLTFRMRR